MADKDGIIELLVEIVDLDAEKTDEFLLFLNNWTHMEFDNEYILNFLHNLDYLPVFKDQCSERFLHLMKIIFEIKDQSHIFTGFILHLIWSLLSLSLINKIKIYSEEMVSHLIEILTQNRIGFELLNFVKNILLSLVELGLTTFQLSKIWEARKRSSLVSEFIFEALNSYPLISMSTIFQNDNDVIEFKDLYLHDPKKGFTISTWFKLNAGVNNLLDPYLSDFKFLSLKDLNENEIIGYSIVNNKLELCTTDREQRFESFNLEIGKLYNLSLVHKCDSKRNTRIDLYINGVFVESKITGFLFSTLTDSLSGFISFTTSIGSTTKDVQLLLKISGPSVKSNVLLELSSLTLINDSNRLEWVYFLYFLGPNYSGDYQDSNLTNLISPKHLINLSLQLKEELEHVSSNSSIHNIKLEPAQLILSFNNSSHVKSYYNWKSWSPPTHGTVLNKAYFPACNKFLFKNHDFLYDVFHSIGGFTDCLNLIEESNSSSELVLGLNLLFKLLDNHGKLSFEFVSSSGYDVLATLLKTKRPLITLEILDSVLNFIGYNSVSPAESIIGDRLAYKSLIVDFEIWQPFMVRGELDSSSKDTFKFLLFQLTVFGQDSKYHLFNVKQLADMKIVKRIIHALKQNLVDEDVLPVLQNLLLIIVKCNPTPDVIKTLQFYVTYTIVQSEKDGDSQKLQRLSGLAVMETLVTLILEILVFEESEKNYRKLLKLISWKWILSVMQSDLKLKKLALKLLIKLLNVYTSKYYLSFSSFGGFSVLTNLLAPFWNDSELFIILYAGAFDLPYASTDISINDFFDIIINKNSEISVKMPQFLNVINNLMGIIANSMDKEDNEDDRLALQTYIECLRESNRSIKNVNIFYNTNIGWMGNFICLIMIMKKSQCNSSEFNRIRSQYLQFLEEILIYKLFSNTNNCDLVFIENLYAQFKVEFNIIVIPLLTQHVRDFQSTLSTVFNNTNTSITFCRIFILYFQSSCKHEHNNLEFLFNLQIIGMIIKRIVKLLHKDSKVLPYVEKLSNDFGKFYILLFISCTENELLKSGSSMKELKKCFQILMEYIHILVKSLSEELKVILFSLLYKNMYVENQELASLSANCLRVFILEQKDVSPIISHLIIDAKNKKQLMEIADHIVSLDDEQLVAQLNLNHEIKCSCNDKFSQSLTLLTKSEFFKGKSESLTDYIDRKLATERSDKILETEITPFSEGIYKSEAKRFNAHLQDSRDDLEYYVEVYQNMKANLPNTDMDMTFTLDSTEGRCRRRNKIVAEIEYRKLKKSSDSSLHFTQKFTSEEADEYDFVSSISDLDLELESFEEDKNRRILRNLYVHDKIDEVFNVTQIRGLETFESVMILGITHVYFIENYFCSANREILESNEAPEEERDSFVKLLKNNSTNEESILKNVKTHKSKSWPISKLVSISKRKFLLRDVAFEMFFIDGSSVLVTCITAEKRNTIFNKLYSKISNKLPDVELEEAMKLASQQKIIFNNQERNFSSKFVHSFLSSDSSDVAFSNVTKKWKNGKLSNFYYLILINTIAGRTFNDLTQYPIFPFVIADYESKVLDLNDSNTFRDFAKPMGAQTEKRAEQFKERYDASKEMSPDTPPFHYGTHYSSAMIVTSYLIRLKPFTQSYLKIQGGKFDHADRLFNSIKKLWNSASRDNTTDVRELIPEFYYLPDFLINSNNYQFGKSQDGTIVNDVELPPWANNDPILFVHLMREALESDYVSAHLNKWIDLTFGFKQQGEKAIESLNVFHYLSYPGSINLDSVIDNHEKAVITSIIHNFGQTPLQIFKKPHPEKNVKIKKLNSNIENLIGLPINDNFKIKENRKYINKRLINKKFRVNKIIFDFHVKQFIGLPWNIDMNEKLNVIINGNSSIIINNRVIFEELCIGSRITALEMFKDGTGRFIIGFKNGYMNIYQLSSDRWTNVTNSQRSSVAYGLEHSHDYKNNSKKLLLLNMGVLRGHFSSIVSIKHNSFDNVLVSLDMSGSLKIWRIDNIFKMTTLSDCGVKKFDIDKELGYILSVDADGVIRLWTINGKIICEAIIRDENNKISDICFAEVNFNEFIEINNSPWDHFIIFGICYEYGKIEIFKVEYNLLKWEFYKIKTMEYEGYISSMRIKLDVGIDGNGINTGRCKIVTGDNNGEIFIWN